jgi:hypothetical protein
MLVVATFDGVEVEEGPWWWWGGARAAGGVLYLCGWSKNDVVICIEQPNFQHMGARWYIQ